MRIAKKGTPRHRSATIAAGNTVEVSDSQLTPYSPIPMSAR